MNRLYSIILGSLLIMGSPAHAVTHDCTELTYSKIIAAFQALDARKLIVNIELSRCGVEEIRSAATIKEYIIRMCAILNLKRYAQPQLIHCSDNKKTNGYAFSLLTEQGTLYGEFVNQNNSAFLSIASNKLFDPFTVKHYCKDHFKAESADIATIVIRS